jgi:hypothetical protein
MSWGAQNRSKDAKTPSVGRGMSENPEQGLWPVQPKTKKAWHCIGQSPGGGWQQATDLRPRDWGEPREGCGEARADPGREDHSCALALLLRRSRQSLCSGWMCSGSYCTSAVAPQVPCGGFGPSAI